MVLQQVADHQAAIDARCDLAQPFGFRNLQRKRLLDEHMLARPGGRHHMLCVQGMRRGDQHGVDGIIVQQCLHRRMNARSELLGERLALVFRA